MFAYEEIMQASPFAPSQQFLPLTCTFPVHSTFFFFSLPIFSPTFPWVRSRGWRRSLCVPVYWNTLPCSLSQVINAGFRVCLYTEIRHAVRCHKWLMKVPVCPVYWNTSRCSLSQVINEGSCGCLYTEIRHPVRCHKWLRQVSACIGSPQNVCRLQNTYH